MGWFFVFLATCSEFLGVYALSLYSARRTLLYGALYYGGLTLSLLFLYFSFNYLLVSVSYTVFIGFGTAGAVLLNMIFFGESKNIYRVASIILIIFGVTGLTAIS